MDLDGIDVFVEVVDALSFSKAAQRLRMPPATVSAKIARLEERLGVTLIQRTTRKLHVTAAGEAYYGYCARAVTEMKEAQQLLTATVAEPSGRLRLTAPVDLSQTVLPPIVERFLEQHPKVSLDLIVTNSRLDLLAEGIDLAVRAGQLVDSRLVARTFFSARVCLWASRDYVARRGLPKTPEDLPDHSFVGISSARGSTPPKLRHGRRTLSFPTDARIACDDLESIRVFVLRGNGIGLLPDIAGADERLVNVLPDFSMPSVPVSLVYAAQRFVPPAVRAFIATATAAYPPRAARAKR